MTTIKDIADRLGISLSTVSKGLNGAKRYQRGASPACLRYSG